MADAKFGKIFTTLQGPVYVAVGFGVLGFQRAQVCRRQLQRRFGGATGVADQVVGAVNEKVTAVNHKVTAVNHRVTEAAVDHLIGAVNRKVAAAAGDVNRKVAAAAGDVNRKVAAAAGDVLGDLFGDATGQLPDEAKELLKAAGDLASDLPGEAKELFKEAVAIGRFAYRMAQGAAAR
jgi:hypothetical protein